MLVVLQTHMPLVLTVPRNVFVSFSSVYTCYLESVKGCQKLADFSFRYFVIFFILFLNSN